MEMIPLVYVPIHTMHSLISLLVSNRDEEKLKVILERNIANLPDSESTVIALCTSRLLRVYLDDDEVTRVLPKDTKHLITIYDFMRDPRKELHALNKYNNESLTLELINFFTLQADITFNTTPKLRRLDNVSINSRFKEKRFRALIGSLKFNTDLATYKNWLTELGIKI